MEILFDLGKLLIPAILVLYGVYLTFRSFLQRETEAQKAEIKAKSIDTVLPLRLQAYERICLFLERITPNSLFIRLSQGKYSAEEFQQILLSEIRSEFNHNVSQQVYMGTEVWDLVKNAKEDLIITINEAGSGLSKEASSIDLAKTVIEKFRSKEYDPINQALKKLKEEVRENF